MLYLLCTSLRKEEKMDNKEVIKSSINGFGGL